MVSSPEPTYDKPDIKLHGKVLLSGSAGGGCSRPPDDRDKLHNIESGDDFTIAEKSS